MVQEIVKDPLSLSRKSKEAGPDDMSTANDLIDTLMSNKDICVGMAANMIGVNKRIIVFFDDSQKPIIMFNPEITDKKMEYETKEGCLSLSGVRNTKRYQLISVEYFDISFKKQKGNYLGWTAQIIQHEIDHCNGILI